MIETTAKLIKSDINLLPWAKCIIQHQKKWVLKNYLLAEEMEETLSTSIVLQGIYIMWTYVDTKILWQLNKQYIVKSYQSQ